MYGHRETWFLYLQLMIGNICQKMEFEKMGSNSLIPCWIFQRFNKTFKICWIFGRKHIFVTKKILSQILFFKTMWFSTFTKPILKEVFINYIQNKVVQPKNNATINRNFIFELILNDWIVHLGKINTYTDILQCANMFFNWFK